MSRFGHVAPTDHNGTNNDEVVAQDGKIRSSAVGAQ